MIVTLFSVLCFLVQTVVSNSNNNINLASSNLFLNALISLFSPLGLNSWLEKPFVCNSG
jgi:hypothetical protein